MTPFTLVQQFKRTLSNIDSWLTKASAYADSRKFDTAVLLQSRLAPDMLPFARQIQLCSDSAKQAAARVAGKEAPSYEDNETTLSDLRERIAKTVAYLDTFKDGDFGGVAERTVTTPRWKGKSMTAVDYLTQHALPNVYFHATTAYLILRHNGVDVGKADFLGPLDQR